jgi:hypothetical protein
MLLGEVGCQVDLAPDDLVAVRRWAATGRLDVAEVPGGPVELASKWLTTGHHPFSTIVRPVGLAHFSMAIA